MGIIIGVALAVIVVGSLIISAYITSERTEQLILKMGYKREEIEAIDVFCEVLGYDYREFPTNERLQKEYRAFKTWKKLHENWRIK